MAYRLVGDPLRSPSIWIQNPKGNQVGYARKAIVSPLQSSIWYIFNINGEMIGSTDSHGAILAIARENAEAMPAAPGETDSIDENAGAKQRKQYESSPLIWDISGLRMILLSAVCTYSLLTIPLYIYLWLNFEDIMYLRDVLFHSVEFKLGVVSYFLALLVPLVENFRRMRSRLVHFASQEVRVAQLSIIAAVATFFVSGALFFVLKDSVEGKRELAWIPNDVYAYAFWLGLPAILAILFQGLYFLPQTLRRIAIDRKRIERNGVTLLQMHLYYFMVGLYACSVIVYIHFDLEPPRSPASFLIMGFAGFLLLISLFSFWPAQSRLSGFDNLWAILSTLLISIFPLFAISFLLGRAEIPFFNDRLPLFLMGLCGVYFISFFFFMKKPR